MERTHLRPLAPRAGSTKRAPEIPPARRGNISTACLECKARKSKCDGGTPCGACARNETQCIYDEYSDKRRRIAMNQKIEDLEADRDLLHRLVTTFRETDYRRTIQLLNLIRNNASLENINVYISGRLNTESKISPELVGSASYLREVRDADPRPQRKVLDVRRLTDHPTWKVPAKPWTAITDDDDFVSHLISLWFTWYHPFSNWIDRDLFIRDMQLGNPKTAKYCSPFLVNIILAGACGYSDYREAYVDAEKLSSKGMHFYEEAKCLYEEEEGRVTLTTVEGLGVLWACACLIGKGRRGWIYEGQLAYAVEDLTRLVYNNNGPGYNPEAVNNVIWGLYNATTESSMSHQKVPFIRTPRRAYLTDPSVTTRNKDIWYPYPIQSGGLQAWTTQLFNASSDLNRITYDLCMAFFDIPDGQKSICFSESMRVAKDIHARLQEWKENLADCLSEGNSNPRHVLALHMYYYIIIVIAFRFVKQKAEEEAQPTELFHLAQTLTLSSARMIAQLENTHQAAWGADCVPVGNVQWITIAQVALLEHLDEHNNHEAFIGLCIAARAFSRRWDVGKKMLQSILTTSRQLGIRLPAETDVFFSDPNFAMSVKAI